MRVKLYIDMDTDAPKDVLGVIHDFSTSFQRTMERGDLDENKKVNMLDSKGNLLGYWEFEK